MAVLLLFCLPLVFFSYAFQLEEKNKHIFMFVVGIAATTLFLLTVSFFSVNTDRYIASLGNYFFYSFFIDTFIPFCIVLLVALIFSGFNVLSIPAALFGLFVVKIYQQLFLASTHLHVMPIVLCIITYASTLLILDALLHFCADITFSYTIVCILCFFLFISTLMLGIFALGLHYFKGNPMIYGSILAGLPLFGAVLHFIIYRKGNSN